MEPRDHEAEASWVSTTEDVADARAADRRELQMKLARAGFLDAESTTPPPPVGSTVPLLRLSRPRRSADELGQRLRTVLAAMSLSLEPSGTAGWASVAVGANHAADAGDPSIFEPSPGVVVVYDAGIDAMMVVNAALLDMTIHIDEDLVRWEDARHVAGALSHAGIMDTITSIEDAEVAFVRSGVAGPHGIHEQWVDEIVFESRPRMNGIEIVDAGTRIGITPTGDVSSIRVSGILAEPVGTMTVGTTAAALREAFAEYVVDSTPAVEAVHVIRRRPAYVLDRNVDSAVVAPHYLIEHSIVVRNGDGLSASRSTMTLWDMSAPVPTLVARLPPVSD